jgi:aspartyl-tRNA(Asn)/glutamyl-tRNA(Gln) amidotransferase subunit B
VLTPDDIEAQRAEMGELPAACRRRLQETMNLPAYDADVIVHQGRPLLQYFERLVSTSGNAKRAANWLQQDILRQLNERGIGIEQFPVSADSLGQLLRQVDAGQLDTTRARDVFQRMAEHGESAEAAAKALGIEQVDDEAIEQLCRELLEANPGIVADVRGGKQQAVGALIGQARKKNPNVNPGQVRQLCLKLILGT